MLSQIHSTGICQHSNARPTAAAQRNQNRTSATNSSQPNQQQNKTGALEKEKKRQQTTVRRTSGRTPAAWSLPHGVGVQQNEAGVEARSSASRSHRAKEATSDGRQHTSRKRVPRPPDQGSRSLTQPKRAAGQRNSLIDTGTNQSCNGIGRRRLAQRVRGQLRRAAITAAPSGCPQQGAYRSRRETGRGDDVDVVAHRYDAGHTGVHHLLRPATRTHAPGAHPLARHGPAGGQVRVRTAARVQH